MEKDEKPKDEKPKAKKIDGPIKGAKNVPMTHNGVTSPVMFYRGDAPKVGTKIRFDMGVIYSGIVSDATEVDGEVMVELRDGLTPES